MTDLPPLAALGPRIVICGPSNAGKSTLAIALGRKLGLPAIHLDLLRHEPHTDWELKPKTEFDRLHAEAIATERWVIEGNYFGLIGERLDRATGIILVGDTRLANLRRYIRRTLFQPNHPGDLEGAPHLVKGQLVRFILIEQPKKRRRDTAILRASGLPMVEARFMRETRLLYRAWDLKG